MARLIQSRYAGKCRVCREPYASGDLVYWQKGIRGVTHKHCSPGDSTEADTPITTIGDSVSSTSHKEGNARIFSIDWPELKSAMQAAISGILPKCRRSDNARSFRRYLTRDNSGFTPGDVKHWLEAGYHLDGLEFDNPPIPIREKRRFIFTDEGDEFHLDRALSGDDEIFSQWTKRQVIPGLAIEAEISFSGGTHYSVLTEYFQFLCRTIYALEKSGVDLQVTIKNSVTGLYPGVGGVPCETHLVIKRENEATDFHSWSAMLSPASLRAYMFACKCLNADEAGEIVSSSMGSPVPRSFGVTWNPEREVIEITPSSNASSFPREEMEAKLKAALAEMNNPQ